MEFSIEPFIIRGALSKPKEFWEYFCCTSTCKYLYTEILANNSKIRLIGVHLMPIKILQAK